MAGPERGESNHQIGGEVTFTDENGIKTTFPAEEAINMALKLGTERGKEVGANTILKMALVQRARERAKKSGY